jgi:hypothetical protein
MRWKARVRPNDRHGGIEMSDLIAKLCSAPGKGTRSRAFRALPIVRARAARRGRDCGGVRGRGRRHVLFDALALAAVADRRRHARACCALGVSRTRGRRCRDRGAGRQHSRGYYQHTGCRSSATAPRGPRFFRGRLDDARPLSIPRCERSLELVSIGEHASADLLPSIVANGATAFLIILAMTIGLILPRMLLKRFLPSSSPEQPRHA